MTQRGWGLSSPRSGGLEAGKTGFTPRTTRPEASPPAGHRRTQVQLGSVGGRAVGSQGQRQVDPPGGVVPGESETARGDGDPVSCQGSLCGTGREDLGPSGGHCWPLSRGTEEQPPEAASGERSTDVPSEMLGRGGCTQTGQRRRKSGPGWVGCSGARKAGISWCWGARGRKGAGKGQLTAGGGREVTECFPPFRCRGSAALCLEGKIQRKAK